MGSWQKPGVLTRFPANQTGAQGNQQFVNMGIRAISREVDSLPVNSRQLHFISPEGAGPCTLAWREGQSGRMGLGGSHWSWAEPRANPGSPAPRCVTLSESLAAEPASDTPRVPQVACAGCPSFLLCFLPSSRTMPTSPTPPLATL